MRLCWRLVDFARCRLVDFARCPLPHHTFQTHPGALPALCLQSALVQASLPLFVVSAYLYLCISRSLRPVFLGMGKVSCSHVLTCCFARWPVYTCFTRCRAPACAHSSLYFTCNLCVVRLSMLACGFGELLCHVFITASCSSHWFLWFVPLQTTHHGGPVD